MNPTTVDLSTWYGSDDDRSDEKTLSFEKWDVDVTIVIMSRWIFKNENSFYKNTKIGQESSTVIRLSTEIKWNLNKCSLNFKIILQLPVHMNAVRSLNLWFPLKTTW